MSPRQRRFVEEYLVSLNAHRAAIAAGYSPRAARQTATKLMQIPELAEAVRQGMKARSERTGIAADRVLLELARVAFADLGRILSWDEKGITLRPFDEIDADDRAAIAALRGGADGRVQVRLFDKLQALETLARHLGLDGGRSRFPAMEPPETSPSPREIIDRRLAALRAIAEREREEEEREERERLGLPAPRPEEEEEEEYEDEEG